MLYSLVVCGGTFDHFHKGHKDFLRFILSHGSKVLIGITNDAFAKHKDFHATIESYEARRKSVETFLQEEQSFNRVSLAAIDSLYIPSEWEQLPIDAIIVSTDSQTGAAVVNKDRQIRGLPLLPIVVCPLTPAEDGNSISSLRIREGEIDREGRIFIDKKWLKKSLILPQALREQLRKPFGLLIKNFSQWISQEEQSYPFATVGDAISQSFINHGHVPQVAVIDFHVQRKRIFEDIGQLGFSGKEIFRSVTNPAGTLQPALLQAIQSILRDKSKNKYVLQIEGEDDLAVLPLLLCAPLGYTVYYGQPNEGVVKITVTEETKKKAYSIVSNFV